MRVLVTGGAGFIGSHIVDALRARGDAVLVIDDLSTGKPENVPPGVEFARLDIRSPDLPVPVARFGADVVVHAAAQSSVPASVVAPAHDASVNIIGGLNVRDAAMAARCRRFVYITTGGALYGDPETLPATEAHAIRPLSPYGLSKWTLERYLRLLVPANMPLAVLRLANVYGPRQDPFGEAGVIAVFAARMLRGEPVQIHGDGEQTRDFVYVGDVARATLLALDTEASLTVNISSGVGTSINELFWLMATASGYDLPPQHGPVRAGDVRHSVLDSSLAHRLLGWRAETSLCDGLAHTVAWLRDAGA
jgi:UDP-glucose 4-epimerase